MINWNLVFHPEHPAPRDRVLLFVMLDQFAAPQAVANMTQRDSTVIVQHAGDWKVHDVLH
jgi:hypothetical protein